MFGVATSKRRSFRLPGASTHFSTRAQSVGLKTCVLTTALDSSRAASMVRSGSALWARAAVPGWSVTPAAKAVERSHLRRLGKDWWLGTVHLWRLWAAMMQAGRVRGRYAADDPAVNSDGQCSFCGAIGHVSGEVVR